MVMEKSWNMQNWPKVMEFCYESWNFTNFATKVHEVCMFLATTEKLSTHVESPQFPQFSMKCRKCKNQQQRWSWKIEKWSWKSHEKIFCQVCGNPGETISIMFPNISKYSFVAIHLVSLHVQGAHAGLKSP